MSSATSSSDSSPIDRLYRALSRGDVAGARSCCAPDARIWHNFDCVSLTLDQAYAGWEAFVAAFPERYITDVRRVDIPGGLLQRHLQVARNTDGVRRAWAICIIASVQNGLITRLDEYMDRGGSIAQNVETTPGLA